MILLLVLIFLMSSNLILYCCIRCGKKADQKLRKYFDQKEGE